MPYWLALVAIPALVQFRAVEAVLRAQGRFGRMNLLEVSLPLSILGLLGVVELLGGLTIYRAVVAWSLGFLPPVVLGYSLLGPSEWPRRLAGRDLLWKAARFGMQGQLSNLIQLLNYRFDSYLVLLLVNASGVGLYAVGVSLSEGMWLIANSVSVVLLTNLTAGDGRERGSHDANSLPQHAAGHCRGFGGRGRAGAVCDPGDLRQRLRRCDRPVLLAAARYRGPGGDEDSRVLCL